MSTVILCKNSENLSPFGPETIEQDFSQKIQFSHFLSEMTFKVQTKTTKFLRAVPEKKLRTKGKTDSRIFHRNLTS